VSEMLRKANAEAERRAAIREEAHKKGSQ